MPTKIEWCDETINPIQDVRKGQSGRGYHCTKTSPGCLNCYAERINKIRGNGEPFDDLPVKFELMESELEKVRKWKKSRSIFVQSMGDLFHEDVSFEIIAEVYLAMSMSLRKANHTYLVLTKRPRQFLNYIHSMSTAVGTPLMISMRDHDVPWKYVHHGLTICNQPEADEKLSEFLKVPGKKFLSIEPMLGEIKLFDCKPFCKWIVPYHTPNEDECMTYCSSCSLAEGHTGIDAVILGGESGAGARPMHPDWVRSIRDQCAAAGVDFFFKQWGEWLPESQINDLAEPISPVTIRNAMYHVWPGGERSFRILKSKAGRLLDGRTHNDLPWR